MNLVPRLKKFSDLRDSNTRKIQDSLCKAKSEIDYLDKFLTHSVVASNDDLASFKTLKKAVFEWLNCYFNQIENEYIIYLKQDFQKKTDVVEKTLRELKYLYEELKDYDFRLYGPDSLHIVHKLYNSDISKEIHDILCKIDKDELVNHDKKIELKQGLLQDIEKMMNNSLKISSESSPNAWNIMAISQTLDIGQVKFQENLFGNTLNSEDSRNDLTGNSLDRLTLSSMPNPSQISDLYPRYVPKAHLEEMKMNNVVTQESEQDDNQAYPDDFNLEDYTSPKLVKVKATIVQDGPVSPLKTGNTIYSDTLYEDEFVNTNRNDSNEEEQEVIETIEEGN